MPYESGEIPGGTENVPAHGQAIYRAAFNSAHAGGQSEQIAHAIAWTAVRKKFKKKGGKWVSKDGAAAMRGFADKEFSAERREKLAKSGKAMPGGGFPIESEQDLKNAIHAIGRAKNPGAARAHIKKRARALGLTKLLPENWDALPNEFTCPACHGTGRDQDGDSGSSRCDECQGTGYIPPPNASATHEREDPGFYPEGDLHLTAKTDAASGMMLPSGMMMPRGAMICPNCGGTGKGPRGGTCRTCDGDGHVGLPANLDLETDARRRRPPEDDEDDDNGDEDDTNDSRIRLTDRLEFVDGGLRRTKDGYLVADARISRTGIQLYDSAELGIPGAGIIRVYRPPEEVFSKASMHSLAHRPITLDHPPMMVDAANWDQYAVGHTGDDVVRDGDHVRVPMVIMDAKAIKAIEGGHKELSVGYSTELKWGKGRTPAGEIYDAKQTAIRGNHLAVVPSARGGSRLRIGDEQRGDAVMAKILIGDRLIELDGDEAKHVQAHIAQLQKDLADARKRKNGNGNGNGDDDDDDADEIEMMRKKVTAEKDAMNGEILALKKQLEDALDPAKQEARDKERLDLMLKADAAMEGKIDFNGKRPEDIRRVVVLSKMGDAAKSLSDAEVIGAFKALTANIKPRSGTDRLADNLQILQFGGGAHLQDAKTLKDAAHAEYVNRLSNAWKGPSYGQKT